MGETDSPLNKCCNLPEILFKITFQPLTEPINQVQLKMSGIYSVVNSLYKKAKIYGALLIKPYKLLNKKYFCRCLLKKLSLSKSSGKLSILSSASEPCLSWTLWPENFGIHSSIAIGQLSTRLLELLSRYQPVFLFEALALIATT